MKNNMNKQAFSLVEMLIALIAISCITVALAPVITKKIKANAVTIIYSQKENKDPKSKEFTTPGEHEFIVPAGVSSMEITIVSGGNGGFAGENSLSTKTIETIGESIFSVPSYLKNKYAKLIMCGGGGGGGAAGTSICHNANYVIFQGAGGGGSGGKIEDKLIQIEDIDIISVYVGGGGTGEVVGSAPENTKPPSIVIWDPCADSLETNNTLCDSLVKYADAGNSGGNGGKTQGLVYQWRAGHGGELAGGSGGIYLGNCGLAGGGGGGGGATRFGIYGEKHYNLVGGGGGGAGEGLRAQLDSTPTIKYNGAPGGGGGGALYISAIDRVKRGGDGGYGKELDRGCNAGGGKGGAPSGNNGEQSGCNVGSGYLDKLVATSGKGGDSPLSNYPNNCAGGHGEGYNYSFDSRLYSDNTYWQKTNPRPNGLNGIIELKYISGNLGGQGGDSGRKITKNISVNEGDTIKIIVGNGGEGGKTSYLDSNGNIVDEQTPQSGEATVVYINSIENFSTDDENSEFVNGQVSDDKDGGSGAKDLNMNCYAGAGGNNSSIKGKNATGYGGCGGGGGYIASDGGRGAGGYAKITY